MNALGFFKAVGFHTTVAPSMSSLILGGLTSRLTDRLAGEKVDLVRQAYSGGPDVNFPLLVVCVNVSRIGADAKEALKGIPKGIEVKVTCENFTSFFFSLVNVFWLNGILTMSGVLIPLVAVGRDEWTQEPCHCEDGRWLNGRRKRYYL